MARNETRTRAQIDANNLDLAMFRLVGLMTQFAAYVGDQDIDTAAARLAGARSRVRDHMHPKDREITNV